MAPSGKVEKLLFETLLDFKPTRINDWGLWILEWDRVGVVCLDIKVGTEVDCTEFLERSL
ncbi:hypothetical protein AHAS_Ahas17G0161200 [Arachis hypogaea]